jgi:hypothetical protein
MSLEGCALLNRRGADEAGPRMVSGGGEVVLVSLRAGSQWEAPVACSHANATVQVSGSEG